MLSTPLLDLSAGPAPRPFIASLVSFADPAGRVGTLPLGAGPRRDPPSPPSSPRPEDRPLTFDDIARIGDTKADEAAEGEGQSSTKGTGSAG